MPRTAGIRASTLGASFARSLLACISKVRFFRLRCNTLLGRNFLVSASPGLPSSTSKNLWFLPLETNLSHGDLGYRAHRRNCSSKDSKPRQRSRQANILHPFRSNSVHLSLRA
jgi:hypothetical protein